MTGNLGPVKTLEKLRSAEPIKHAFVFLRGENNVLNSAKVTFILDKALCFKVSPIQGLLGENNGDHGSWIELKLLLLSLPSQATINSFA